MATTKPKARATRKPAAAPKRTTTRKPTVAKRALTVPNKATKALARACGAGWVATGSTMANKCHLRYNGRTVVWVVQGKQGNTLHRRAIGLRSGAPTVATVRGALAKLRKANLA